MCADCQLPDTEAEAKPYVTPQPVENEDKLPLYVTPALPGARTPAAYEAEAGVTRKRMMWEELGYAE